MAKGTVDRYSEDKGYGFIRKENNGEVLVERSSINMPGYKTLIPGDRVTFEVEETARGLEAKNVKKL